MEKKTLLVGLAIVVAASGAFALQAGATSQADTQVQSISVVQEQIQLPNDQESFIIDSVSAPDSASPGTDVVIGAVLENPNADRTVQPVEVRIDGDVVARDRVGIEGNGTGSVSLTVNASDLESGENAFQVLTGEDGVQGTINISESFTVSEFEAPENVTQGEAVTVNFTVENPNDNETTQSVAFRFDGVPVITEEVTIEGDNSTSFSTEIESVDAEPGTYLHGVYTRDAGAVAELEVVRGPVAEVTFSDQESDGTNVTVDSVNLSDGGFVVIHDDSLFAGDVIGSVIGVSEYLEPGEQEDVEITLFDVPGGEFNESELTGNQTLIAMPHLDTNNNETYDFVTTGGEEDGPYTDAAGAVVSIADVTGPDADEGDDAGDADESDEGDADDETDEPTDDETDEPTDDETTDGDETGDETTDGDETGDETTDGDETGDETTDGGEDDSDTTGEEDGNTSDA